MRRIALSSYPAPKFVRDGYANAASAASATI